MNILLISPNTLTDPYPVYPIGLDYVAGAIGPAHEVLIADLNSLSRADLAERIANFSPALIGISIRNIDNTEAGEPLFFINACQELIAWLRQQSPALIVCGGSGFTIMPAEILAMVQADYGIIGEGERLADFIAAVDEGRDPATIPGVLRAGQVVILPPPRPDGGQRLLPPVAGHQDFYLRRGGMLNLQTKRGCAFRCIYCPYPRIEGRSHRLTEPAQVAATARQLQEAGAKYLFFTDSAFNSDISHSIAVARALEETALAIPWGAFFAPVKLPADYFALMAAAGCRHVEFGTESLAPTMLSAYRKPFQPADVSTAHHQARAAGLHVAHYLLLGGPGESAASLDTCLAGLDQLHRAVFFFFIGIRIYPGTALYDIALAEGQIDGETDMLQPVFYQPQGINLTDIRRLVETRAAGRRNWLIGAGGEAAAKTVRRLHERGLTGPLWEYLAQ